MNPYKHAFVPLTRTATQPSPVVDGRLKLFHWLMCLTGLVLLLAGSLGHAGNFANSYGTSGATTKVLSTSTDSSGNIYIAGAFTGASLAVGAVNLTRIGPQDAFVAKLDSTGTTVWAKNFGGISASSQAQSVWVDGSGNVLVGGDFTASSLSTPALTLTGSRDAFAIKLDSSGNTTWAKNFGGSGAAAFGTGISADRLGNVVLGGYFTTNNLTTPALTKTGTIDGFAIKMKASDGTTEWAKNFGGNAASTYFKGIAVDVSGSVVLGGYFETANLTTPALTLTGGADALLIKLDGSGNTTWAQNFYGAGSTTIGHRVAVGAGGEVFLTGIFNADLSEPAITLGGTQDSFVIKTNSAGQKIWAVRLYGSGVPTTAYGITVDADGSVYVTGEFNGNLTNPGLTLTSGASNDIFAVRLNGVNGGETWSANFGGSGASATGHSISLDSTGHVVVGGFFQGNNLTTPVLSLTGSTDALLIKQLPTSAAPTKPVFSTTQGNGKMALTFATPANNGAALTGYTVTVNDNGNMALNRPQTRSSCTNCGGNGSFAGGGFASVQTILTLSGVTAGTTVSSGGLTATIRNVSGGKTVVLVSGLTNGNNYTFAVGATNANGTTTSTTTGNIMSVSDLAANYGLALSTASVRGTATDASGNIYITGLFSGTTLPLGISTLTRVGVSDGFVAKLSPNGNTQWAVSFGGAGASVEGNTIAVDALGNVLVGGHFSTANLTDLSLTKTGNTDAFVVKLNSNGTTVWAKNFGGSGADVYGKAIAVDGTGNVYLGGFFQSANLSNPVLTKFGGSDAYVIRLDSKGNTTWAKNFGGSGSAAVGQAIAATPEGEAVLHGYYSSASLTTPALTLTGATDAFALKLDIVGETIWSKRFGGSGATTNAHAVALDPSGNVFLGGYFQSANLTTPAVTKLGLVDAYAFKLDSNGTTTQSKNFGGSGASTYGFAIASDLSGNMLLGGRINAPITTPPLTPLGTEDAFAVRVDTTGSIQWASRFGGSGATTINNGLAADVAGDVLLGGYFQSANLSAPALTLIGTQDVFIFKTVPVATVPGAPTGVSATASSGQASVSFTAPSTGGSAITSYTATSSPGGFTSSGCTASPCTVTGLNNGTAYTFTVTATNAVGTGAASSASGSVTPTAVPGAPTIGSATAGNGQASITFSAPASNGGSAITGYTATSSPGGFTSSGCSASPCIVSGLTNGTAYTFTVTATNATGTGSASAASNSVTPATLPGAPTIGSATAGDSQASISFTPPANTGGAAITSYTATSSPGNITSNACTGSPCVVAGLSNGTSYTFTVTATNSAGTGSASAASNSVTPAAPVVVLSSNANLGGLTVSSGNLSPSFSSANTGYVVSVPNSVASLTLTAAVQDSTASLSVNGSTVGSGSPVTVSLAVGSNTVEVLVRAQNGSTTQAYSVVILRAQPSANANLAGLAVSGATLTPGFDAATTLYTATVSNSTTTLALTPTVADNNATVTVNGTQVASGSASAPIALVVGLNPIAVTVKAQNGNTQTYSLAITRAPSPNADLAGLSISQGTLSPAFGAGRTSYTASVPNATTALTLTATVAEATAKLSVNGVTVSSGSPTASLPLKEGVNTLLVLVTAPDGKTTKIYTVTVTRTVATLTLSGNGSFDFGRVIAGERATTTLTLSNTGSEAAQISNITLTQPFAAFSDCPNPLPVAGRCTLTLFFIPVAIDAVKGGKPWASSLVITGNANVIGLPFNVTGVALPKPVPLPATFADAVGVDLNVQVVSNEIDPVVLSPTAVSITGGQFSINGGAFGTSPATLNPGDTVKVQHVSSNKNSTVVTTNLLVGTKTLAFKSTTIDKPFTIANGNLSSDQITVSVMNESPNQNGVGTLSIDIDLSSFFRQNQRAGNQFAANDDFRVYVAGIIPTGVLGIEAPTVFFKNLQRAWVGVSSPLAAYLENVTLSAGSSKVTLSVLSDFDFGLITGVEFYVGLGTSEEEMFASQRYRAFYKVP